MIYICLRIVAILFFLVIISMIVKDRLKIKYSVLWILFSVILIIISFNINLVENMSKLLDIYYAPATIFLFAITFLIIYILHLSIVVTSQEKYIVNIVQEISMLKEKNDKEKGNSAADSKKI